MEILTTPYYENLLKTLKKELGMLVIPNNLHKLLSSRHPFGKEKDIEKNDEYDASTPQEEGRSGHLPRGNQRRPTSLDLKAEHLHEFKFEDPKTAETTRTYRLLPIFSGIMIPFSIMLSIPSLTGHWYIRTDANGGLLETRANPPLLDAAMGLSMGCGILASACLVIRFAERKIKLMTFLCIVFLTLHDLINIPSVTVFGVEHRFDDGFTYGQSFWFTVCSTIASTATNITLITDYCQTQDFDHSGSGLTHKQRSLVIMVIVLLCYVSIGSLILAVMLKVSFIDALYLSVVSIETVGFGDLHPNSTGTRVFTCCYIAGGILNLALAVALSREALLESAAVGFRSRLKAAEARQRERHIRSRWRAAVRWRLREQGQPIWIDDRDEERRQRVGSRRHHHWYSWIRHIWRKLWDEVWREWEDPAWKYVYGPRHKRLNLEALTESQLETAALEAGAPLAELIPKGLKLRGARSSNEFQDSDNTNSPNPFFPRIDSINSVNAPSLTHVRMGGMVSLLGKFAVAVAHGSEMEPQTSESLEEDELDGTPNGDDNGYTQTAGRGVPFTRTMTMTTIPEDHTSLAESLEKEERNAFRARLTVALTLFVVFWMAGSAIFMQTEAWTFGSAVYFCFVSFTTVGYGDFAPRTPAGRSIFVVWALLGVGTMTILISILAEAYSNQYKSVIKSEIIEETSSTIEISNVTKFHDSRTILNTGTDLETFRPPFSAGSGWNAPSFASSATPYPRSRGQSMAPIPELQLGTGLTTQQRVLNERLEALPRQVLRHADTIRTLLAGMSPKNDFVEGCTDDIRTNDFDHPSMEILLDEIERSLKDVANAAQETLDASDS